MLQNLKINWKSLASRIGKLELEKATINRTADFNRHEAEVAQEKSFDSEAALAFVKGISTQLQNSIESQFSNVVVAALNHVMEEEIGFRMEFLERRGTIECDFYLKENDVEYDPEDNSGGGVFDITSFALRCIYWKKDGSRPTLILDEPFKFVSPDYHEALSTMLSDFSKKYGVQIIMVSHADNVNIHADRTFLVEKIDGISHVRTLS